MHSTPLKDRVDLEPDVAALRFDLAEMLTPRFAALYAPIGSARPERDSNTVEQAITECHERFSGFENATGYYLLDADGAPVAAGLLRTFQEKVAIDVIGVLPDLRGRGRGNRLHRHLLWAARGLADLHEGGTDASNATMRHLLEKNGCIFAAEEQ